MVVDSLWEAGKLKNSGVVDGVMTLSEKCISVKEEEPDESSNDVSGVLIFCLVTGGEATICVSCSSVVGTAVFAL